MTTLFVILIILASAVLGLIVLIQNPKGGGLAGSVGGFSNQLMGVKQTTDVLEKGTWVFAAIVGLLCLMSPAFIPKEGAASGDDLIKGISTSPAQQAKPENTATMPAVDTNKK